MVQDTPDCVHGNSPWSGSEEEKAKHQLIPLPLAATVHHAESLMQAAPTVLAQFTFLFVHISHGRWVAGVFSSTQ